MAAAAEKKYRLAPLRFLKEYTWGGGALISLSLSILSGIVVALQFNAAEPFYATTTIELVVPYGSFWRALHYFSSQAFFLFLLVHLGIVLWKNEMDYKRGAWIRLCATVPCGLLLLFTGYVLRDDATGEAAGTIAEHICLSIPLIGTQINNVFFDLSDSGVNKVYAHHVIGLVVLGGMAAWPHLRRYTVRWRDHLLLILVTMLLSVLLTAPMEPNRFGLLFIAGPWFFLGLQELLRSLPPFIAGVVTPLLPLGLLFWLPKTAPARIWVLRALILWFLAYGTLTFLCVQRI